MSDDITLRDLMQLCTYRTVVGRGDADLLGPASAVLALTTSGSMPDAADLALLLGVLRRGGSVLVAAAEREDRDRVLAKLRVDPARRSSGWGRA